MPVIIKDLQFDAMKNRVIHVDFYKVNMDKEVEAEVSVNFIGESPAVKAHGAIIVQHLDQLHIECLPGDLIQKIDVDMSALKEIGDTIHVSDIPAMKGITIKNDANEIIVNAVEPQKEVEAAPAAPAEGEAAVPAADAAKAEGEEKAEEKK
jgi:large subunit ribosomal protein L25